MLRVYQRADRPGWPKHRGVPRRIVASNNWFSMGRASISVLALAHEQGCGRASHILQHCLGLSLEEQQRHPKHDQDESKIGERKHPPTTAVYAVSELVLSPLVQRAHHQVDPGAGDERQRWWGSAMNAGVKLSVFTLGYIPYSAITTPRKAVLRMRRRRSATIPTPCAQRLPVNPRHTSTMPAPRWGSERAAIIGCPSTVTLLA